MIKVLCLDHPDYFVPMFRRTLGGEYQWCAQWWQHGEAIKRLTSLWHAPGKCCATAAAQVGLAVHGPASSATTWPRW